MKIIYASHTYLSMHCCFTDVIAIVHCLMYTSA